MSRCGFLWAAGLVWFITTTFGFYCLTNYAVTSGVQTEQPGRWPTNVSLNVRPNGRQLLMFAHPRCPCSRASIQELSRLVAITNSRATVVFWSPDIADRDISEQAEWKESRLVRQVQQDSRLEVRFDPEGRNMKQFGVTTSGHCLLYDSHANLVFSGGITLGRGHEGPNEGQDQLVRLLSEGRPIESNAAFEYPVFGCRIELRAEP